MIKGSTHMHSTGSDGKLSSEEVIKKAIELKWDYVYFTDHYFKLKIYTPKYKHDYFNKKYIEDVKKLKEKYKNKIEVCFGVELDWLEEDSKWLKKESKKENFDYVLGSVHRFQTKAMEDRAIEHGKDYWLESAKKFGGVKEYVGEYYKQIKNLIKSGIFDCVGHLDYIKVYNENGDLFSENSEWYKKEIFGVLDLIKRKNMILELNTSGLRKCEAMFPSTWILKESKKRNIPITIGLDVHKNEHMSNELLESAVQILRKVGYKEIVRFKKRRMIKENLK